MLPFNLLKIVAEKVVDFFLPPTCAVCRCVVSESHSLCGQCWPHMQFISQPFCTQCARPFEFGEEDISLRCGQCLKDKPFYTKTVAVFLYDDFSRRLILSFKHGNALYIAPLLSKWMVAFGEQVLRGADILVPVPLHWTRLMARGFNQSSVLAKLISRTIKIPIMFDLLKRIKKTPPQGILSGEQRRQNVSRAFKVEARNFPQLKGKIVVLIDDVRTSGATVNACAQTLLAAGAQEVRVLCAARVR